jgi:type IV secretory pathway VirB2 component (pilin)
VLAVVVVAKAGSSLTFGRLHWARSPIVLR